MHYVQDELRVERMGYRLGEGKQAVTLGMRRTNSSYELVVEGATQFSFRRTPGRPRQLPPPNRSYGFPDEVR
ncbi:MAG: hypothetical protein Q9M35_04325, partial [Rhodothermus sp.]|nr:hypothetical protein [Rhodothermus sp.]